MNKLTTSNTVAEYLSHYSPARTAEILQVLFYSYLESDYPTFQTGLERSELYSFVESTKELVKSLQGE